MDYASNISTSLSPNTKTYALKISTVSLTFTSAPREALLRRTRCQMRTLQPGGSLPSRGHRRGVGAGLWNTAPAAARTYAAGSPVQPGVGNLELRLLLACDRQTHPLGLLLPLTAPAGQPAWIERHYSSYATAPQSSRFLNCCDWF